MAPSILLSIPENMGYYNTPDIFFQKYFFPATIYVSVNLLIKEAVE